MSHRALLLLTLVIQSGRGYAPGVKNVLGVGVRRGLGHALLVAALLFGCDQRGSAVPIRPTPAHLRSPAAFQKGVGLGLYYEHDGRPYETMLDEIAALGADHVEFVLHWTQKDIRSLDIEPHPVDTVKDQRLLEAMDYAHTKGLRVFLFPIIDVAQRKTGEWRGTIKPGGGSKEEWDKWWKAYERYVLYYADLAEKGGAALYSVGSELVSTEEMCDRWNPLIKKVRERFKGKLIYSANWDHYKQVCFWEKLDYAGMTGYYVLTNSKEPAYEDLVAAWKKIQVEIMAWKKTISIPLVFTEIGYPSQDGSNMTPWDYTTSNPVDLNEQFLCYKAFREVWQGEDGFSGVYFWNWYEPGGLTDKTYSPRGKPAEQIIKEWFASKTVGSR
jgi:hypothetical protein